MAYQQRSAGQMIQLPPKTTSFKHWAERLTAYAQSAELRQDLTYWLAVPCAQVGRLPVDYPGDANMVAWARTVSVSLSTAETRALLQEAPKAYQLQINDVLLTALAQTLARWTGERTLLLDLEGHGREEVVDGVDLSRTVGWFTTLFPVFLQLEHTYTPAAALKSVKEQLRRIPRHGFGYGVLRYLSQDTEVIEALRSLPPAEVCFNYLGRGDQLRSGPLFSGPLRETSGPHRSKRGRRCYLLEVNSRLTGGQLQCDWTYSERMHRRDTVAGLAQGFIEALRMLIRHCQSPEAGGYTPSDFPTMRLSQQELDELMITLSESGRTRRAMSSRNNIEDIYPLAPMQQGILFHTLYAPASGVYCEQWQCTPPWASPGRGLASRPGSMWWNVTRCCVLPSTGRTGLSRFKSSIGV